MTMTDVNAVRSELTLLVDKDAPVTLATLVLRAKWPLLWGSLFGCLLIAISLWLMGPFAAWTWQLWAFAAVGLLVVVYFTAYWYSSVLQDEAEVLWTEFVKKQTPPQLKGRPDESRVYALKKAAHEVYAKMSDSVTKGTLDSFAVALEGVEDGWKDLLDREAVLFEKHAMSSLVPPAWRKLGCTAAERTRLQVRFVSCANKAGDDLFQLREEMGRMQVYQDELLGRVAVAQ